MTSEGVVALGSLVVAALALVVSFANTRFQAKAALELEHARWIRDRRERTYDPALKWSGQVFAWGDGLARSLPPANRVERPAPPPDDLGHAVDMYASETSREAWRKVVFGLADTHAGDEAELHGAWLAAAAEAMGAAMATELRTGRDSSLDELEHKANDTLVRRYGRRSVHGFYGSSGPVEDT